MALPGRAPPVPVALRALRVARLLEPCVLVGRVVDDQVHDQLDPAVVQLLDELVDVVERAEERVDVLVVRDVVAVVVLRRRVHRGQPHHVDAEHRQVVEVPEDPLDVADPVAVRVGERPGIDLVDDGAPPPLVGAGVTGTLNDRCHEQNSFVPAPGPQRFRTFRAGLDHARGEQYRTRGEHLCARGEQYRTWGEQYRARGEQYRTRGEHLCGGGEQFRRQTPHLCSPPAPKCSPLPPKCSPPAQRCSPRAPKCSRRAVQGLPRGVGVRGGGREGTAWGSPCTGPCPTGGSSRRLRGRRRVRTR